MDDPQIAVLILLDTPSNETGIYISGGQMAAPTVGRFFADALPYLGYEPSYTPEQLADLSRTVPDLSGLELGEAQAALRNAGLNSRVVGSGDHITAQLPLGGSAIAAGSSVILYTEGGPAGESTSVPDLSGMEFDDAASLLAGYDLFIRRSSAGSDGTITYQSVPAGSSVESGTVIEVILTDTGELGRY